MLKSLNRPWRLAVLTPAAFLASMWATEAKALVPSGVPLAAITLALVLPAVGALYALVHRRLLAGVACALSVAAAIAGAFMGSQSLAVAYNRACPTSEDVRQAILRYQQEHIGLPTSLPDAPQLEIGKRLLHPPVLRYRITGSASFEITCTDGFVYWYGTELYPMRPAK